MLLQLIAVDLDGDGDFDLATANRDSGRVVWYENLLINTLDDDDGGSDAAGTTAPVAPTVAPTTAVDPFPTDVTSETRAKFGGVGRGRRKVPENVRPLCGTLAWVVARFVGKRGQDVG